MCFHHRLQDNMVNHLRPYDYCRCMDYQDKHVATASLTFVVAWILLSVAGLPGGWAFFPAFGLGCIVLNVLKAEEKGK